MSVSVPVFWLILCVVVIVLQESDWNVLQCVLENLPSLLQNKTLVSVACPRDVEKICLRLCKLVSEPHTQQFNGCPCR